MAKQSDVNFTSASSAEVGFRLKEVLKLAGWTVQSSSDGTTYNATGDQITTSGSGAGGMANNRAWFRIQDPSGRRELVFQLGTGTGSTWRVTYSALDKFVGGAPSATQVPSATDGVVLVGGGTDASPTFATFFRSGYLTSIVCDSVPFGNVYWFFVMQHLTSNPSTKYLYGMDALSVYSSANNDPCFWIDGAPNNVQCKAWYAYGFADQAFGLVEALDVGNGTTNLLAPGFAGVSPYTGSDDHVGVPVSKFASDGPPSGFLGVSNKLRLKLVNRDYPDTIDLATDAYVYFGDYLVPFADGVAPIV